MELFILFLRFQCKQLVASRTLIITAVSFFGVIVFSLYNGKQQTNIIVRNQINITKNLAEKEVALFKAIKNNDADFTPYTLGGKTAKRYFMKEVDAFSGLSLGLSKIFPSEHSISLRDEDFSILDESSKIDNPLLLSLGNFDFSFVMIWLLPLFIIALSFNLLSSEIEMGTFPILISQAVTIKTLLWLKTMAQYLLFIIYLLMSCLIAFTMIEPDIYSNITSVLYLLGSLFLYGLFWFLISLWVNLFQQSSLTNISLLFSIWLILVLIVPTTLGMVANWRNPVPSRLKLVNDLRTATKEIDNDAATLLNNYYYDHPELAPKSENRSMANYVYKNALKRKMVHDVAFPIVSTYYNQLSKQESFLSNFKFISPSLLVQSIIDDLANNTLKDFIAFHRAVDAKRLVWNKTFENKIFKDEKLTEEEIKSLPTFKHFQINEKRYNWLLVFEFILYCIILIVVINKFNSYRKE